MRSACRTKAGLFIATCLVWAGFVLGGIVALYDYSDAPGAVGQAPQHWPAASAIRPQPGRAMLIMVAHPKCPCTRASIRELDLLMTQAGPGLSATVLFNRPAGVPASGTDSDLWRQASMIPGVTVLADDDGMETSLFGAMTSGETVLYDERGDLRFHGGITGARGHSGDNAGRSAIVDFVRRDELTRAQTFVFGCELHDPGGECAEGQQSCRM